MVEFQNQFETTTERETIIPNNFKGVIVLCQDLVKIYGSGATEVHALRGINLEIKEGEFVAIVGSSGSGKTTLLNLLGGLDSPTSGKIFFCGREISSFSEKERTLFRREVGFIFQNFNLHPVLTTAQNIELPLILAGKTKEERKKRVKVLIDQVGLSGREHHLPSELSGGEKQRVGIARALGNKPKLLLADQPTGNLDSETGQEIMQLLMELRFQNKVTICMVTHNLEIAKKADKMAEIEDGKIHDFKVISGG